MRTPPHPYLKYVFAALLSFFLLGGEPVEFGSEKNFFQDYLIPKPVIHITSSLETLMRRSSRATKSI